MSTLEMICWVVLWILMGILSAGTGWMILTGQATSAESERFIAQADEEDRRATAP